jgi:hypothetical protein
VKGAGGSEGGVVRFFAGLAMAVGAAYLLAQRELVSAAFRGLFGSHTLEVTLFMLIAGAGLLFYDGRSRLGWTLTLAGALIVLLGVLMNPRVYFEPTSLIDTLIALILFAAGLGLVARSLRPPPGGGRSHDGPFS